MTSEVHQLSHIGSGKAQENATGLIRAHDGLRIGDWGTGMVGVI